MTRWTTITLSIGAGLGCSACRGVQSALDVHGTGAAEIAWLFWLFTGICVVVWMLVMAGLALSLRPAGMTAENPRAERLAKSWMSIFVGITAVILVVLTAASFLTGHSLAKLADDEDLTLKVNGHQWWWEVRYEDPAPSRVLTVANEIHIPVGRRVRLELVSADVIHSLWVPSLSGKMDLVPGRENTLTIRAERAGVYRGQCAEFCGFQHAHMAVLVIAEDEADFARWYDTQLQPAEEPTEPDRKRGRDVFVAAACVMCHQVRGTPSGGRLGPDLTHLASRRTLAAGLLPMAPENIAGWIADPQGLKPGNNMPKVALSADDLGALTLYFAGLK